MFYSTLYKKNCIHHTYIDDHTLPLPLQRFMYSWYLHSFENDIWDNKPPQENPSPSFDPFRKSHKHPIKKISSMGGGGI